MKRAATVLLTVAVFVFTLMTTWKRGRQILADRLRAATLPLEANVALALLHDAGGENDRKLIAPAVAAYVNLHGRPELAAAQASREAGNAPRVKIHQW